MADGRGDARIGSAGSTAAERFFPDTPDAARLAQGFARGARFPMTTSLGRLFDAAAALAGVCLDQRYEGQAAMELEALVETPRAGRRAVAHRGGPARPGAAAGGDRRRGLAGREAAELFHGALIGALDDWIGAAARGARADARSRSAAAV